MAPQYSYRVRSTNPDTGTVWKTRVPSDYANLSNISWGESVCTESSNYWKWISVSKVRIKDFPKKINCGEGVVKLNFL